MGPREETKDWDQGMELRIETKGLNKGFGPREETNDWDQGRKLRIWTKGGN